jgi:hypothetical protein
VLLGSDMLARADSELYVAKGTSRHTIGEPVVT